ncbi:hypothetical protein [Asanoa iriomotensis]|uniref:Uncharacterized protein n=1 Tax=Asanoa iriomotensis TaxID=234613 RepID=A0ABQ4CFY1_9ACTN|nr:hypothetical protein [Asanoa iriomotensis]GIF61686.1 hypothetical protein Air01nite_77810 [Asanoa iriomotensis]
MTDDWTWGDGHDSHDDHSGYDGPGSGDEHHHGFDADDTDPFGDSLGDAFTAGHDAMGGHDVVGWHDPSPDWGGDEGDGPHGDDPFAPVAEHHDWAAGLDDDGSGGTDGFGPVDATDLFSADPDVSAYTDALWPTPEFPAALDLGPVLPEPIDGPPWTDASALGAPGPDGLMPVEVPSPSDLAAYAGLEPASSGWEALLGSEDPATSALARFWSPPNS